MKKIVLILIILSMGACSMINNVDYGTDTIVQKNKFYTEEQILSHIESMRFTLDKKGKDYYIASTDIRGEKGAMLTVEMKKKNNNWIFRGVFRSIMYYDELKRDYVYKTSRVYSESRGDEYNHGWLVLGQFADELKMKY